MKSKGRGSWVQRNGEVEGSQETRHAIDGQFLLLHRDIERRRVKEQKGKHLPSSTAYSTAIANQLPKMPSSRILVNRSYQEKGAEIPLAGAAKTQAGKHSEKYFPEESVG